MATANSFSFRNACSTLVFGQLKCYFSCFINIITEISKEKNVYISKETPNEQKEGERRKGVGQREEEEGKDG